MAEPQEKSKKPSDGNEEQQQSPPDDLVLFLDENLDNCSPILEALKTLRVTYKRHRDIFKAGEEDIVWLPVVGARGWVLITKDKRIRYNELEKKAIIRAKVREFCLSGGNHSGNDMANMLKSAMAKIKRLCRKQAAPFIATITKSGAVNLRYPKQ